MEKKHKQSLFYLYLIIINYKIACFRFFEEEKKLNPLRIILVRIGDFYEAIGIDAVIILNVTDIAAFNHSYCVPRIKCSMRNRDELLRVLVIECGLEVVICEESDKFVNGTEFILII